MSCFPASCGLQSSGVLGHSLFCGATFQFCPPHPDRAICQPALPTQDSPAASTRRPSQHPSTCSSPALPLRPWYREGDLRYDRVPLASAGVWHQWTLTECSVHEPSHLSVCHGFHPERLRKAGGHRVSRQARRKERGKERKRKLCPMSNRMEHHFQDNEKWLKENILEVVNILQDGKQDHITGCAEPS